MKKLFTLMLLFSILLIAACQDPIIIEDDEPTTYLNISLDLKTREVTTSTSGISFDLEVLNEKFRLKIDFTSLNSIPAFKINDSVVESNEYSTQGKIVTLEFFADRFVEANETLPVLVKFNPAGGQYTKEVIAQTEAFRSFTFKDFNALNSNNYTIVSKRDNGLRWNYKLFIKYNNDLDLYEVVYGDPALKLIEHLDLPDYDFILATYHQNIDFENNEELRNFFSNETIGYLVDFDSDLNEYTGGDLAVNFYKPMPDEDTFSLVIDEETILPEIYRKNFEFKGWFDGETTLETFIPMKASDHKNVVTLQALWEGASMTALDQYLNSIIPSYTDKSIKLPLSFSSYQITWSSSNTDVIENDGTFHVSYGDKKVVLTAHISSDSGEFTRTYEINVLFKKSLQIPIASSYIYRNYDAVNDAFFETLDIINTAFITADSNGNLSGPAVLNNIQTHIFPKARTYGNWVIFSVAPESQWSNIVLTSARIENFANQIVNMINTYGFDGVDIDWETPTPSEATLYTALMTVVYQKVKANNPHHLVTTAITGGQWQPPRYDLTNSKQYIDYINVMTYSMASSGGSYQNPLYKQSTFHHAEFKVARSAATASIDESVPIFNGYGVQNSKLIFGLAFYGVKQTRTYNSSTGVYGSWVSAGSVFYDVLISNYLSNDNYLKIYDTVAKVPYIVNTQGTEFVSYDSPRSIQDKGEYILAKGLGGLMFWEYGTDTSGILLAAMGSALNKS